MYKIEKIFRSIIVFIGALLVLTGFILINENEKLATAFVSIGLGFTYGNIIAVIASTPTIKEDSKDE